MMQNFRILGALAAAAFVSGAAHAQVPGGEAMLVAPAAAQQAVVDGVAWRCEGKQCAGAGRQSAGNGLVKECRRVAAVIGPVASYSSGGRQLTAGQVRACNRAAATIQTARN